MNDKELIRAVIATLDSIQVQGRENMQKLMNCITVLEKLIGMHADLNITYTNEYQQELSQEAKEEPTEKPAGSF